MTQSLSKISPRLSAAGIALVIAFSLTSCGGNGDGNGGGQTSSTKLGADAGWTFDTTTLKSACSSLTISTTSNTSFPAGTTVTFQDSNGHSYNGDTSAVAGTSLYSGFPSGAVSGTYEVIVQTPGGGPQDAGTVQYDADPC